MTIKKLLWKSDEKLVTTGQKSLHNSFHINVRGSEKIVPQGCPDYQVLIINWDCPYRLEVKISILLSSESVDRSNIVGPLPKLFESRKESQWRLPSTKVDICSYFILLKIQFWGNFLLARTEIRKAISIFAAVRYCVVESGCIVGLISLNIC